MERSIWSQWAIICCMSDDKRPPCRTVCRIWAQWAIMDWWSMPAMLCPCMPPDMVCPAWPCMDWPLAVPCPDIAAGLLCCCCGAQATKPAASSSARPAPTCFPCPVTVVSSR